MRTATRLLLLCATAIAAMALGATNAAAQEEAIHVEHEGGGACSAVDPCLIVLEGELVFQDEATGDVLSRCEDTFEAELTDESGLGHMTWDQESHPDGSVCGVRNCIEDAEAEWNIEEAGETAANEGHLHIRFCIRELFTTTDLHCPEAEGNHAEFRVEEVGLHHYELDLVGVHCFGLLLSGSWTTHENPPAPHEDIEIVHASG